MKSLFRFLAVFTLLGISNIAAAGGGHVVAASLIWRGDYATTRAFVKDMAAAWHHSGHPRMTLQSFNTISALDQLSRGQVDIAGTARSGSPRRAKEHSLQFTPIAWDALVIITSHHNPVRGITLKQLHDIYFGKIHNWNQLGGRDEPINVYAVASPTDGVEFSLRKLLYGRGNQAVAAPRLYINVHSLEKGVALDPASLGVSTLSGVYDNPKLKMLAIAGVPPTPTHVADGSYPLYTPLYLVTRDNQHSASVQAFIDFTASSTGKSILRHNQLLPYADGLMLSKQEKKRAARIADAVGRTMRNGPTAAPRATYTARTALAPTSPLTQAARERILEQNARAARNRKAAEHSNQVNAAAVQANDGNR